MKKLIRPGQIIFATGIIGLGVLQFFAKDFIVGRPPVVQWASNIPGKEAWAYVSGIVLVIGGLSVIFQNRYTSSISFFTGFFIFIFSFLCRHLPNLFTSNTAQDAIWQINAYKTLALCGGAFIVAASFDKRSLQMQVTLSCVLLALFFIISGFAHFKFDDFIIYSFIPAYIPFHPFWTYVCGIALIAGGVGLLIKQTRKWAAALTGFMILLWFFLLHIPRASHAPHDHSEWMGVCESFSFSGILFTLAGLSSK
jgi:uncharacterized membrane protein